MRKSCKNPSFHLKRVKHKFCKNKMHLQIGMLKALMHKSYFLVKLMHFRVFMLKIIMHEVGKNYAYPHFYV